MTRGMSLTLLLMGASMAAAIASPGVDAQPAPWGCTHADPRSAQVAPAALAASPAGAGMVGGAPYRQVPCTPDAGQVYRQWHHGGTKVGIDCVPPQTGEASLARRH